MNLNIKKTAIFILILQSLIIHGKTKIHFLVSPCDSSKKTICKASETPAKLKFINDTLKFIDQNTENALKYTMININDQLEIDLISTNGYYYVKLKNNHNYLLISKRGEIIDNKIHLSIYKDSLSNDFNIKFKSANKSIEFEEDFSLSFFNKPLNSKNYTIQFSSVEINNETINLELNTSGNFKYNELLWPNKQYIFYSKIFN